LDLSGNYISDEGEQYLMNELSNIHAKVELYQWSSVSERKSHSE